MFLKIWVSDYYSDNLKEKAVITEDIWRTNMDMEKVKVLYTIGDSFVYGHGLDSRWSTTLSKRVGGLDCNVSLTHQMTEPLGL